MTWWSAYIFKVMRASFNDKMGCVVPLNILLVFLHVVTGYPQYQGYVPNGQRVPNPCVPDTIWPGVGHTNPAGGGERNPFGLDFAAASYNWADVCSLDSDGDGKTNGQELGDPGCTWVRDTPPPLATNITHPGVCEPLSASNCQERNSWLICPSKFDCPAINEPDVLQLPLRIPPTPVPTKETTYMCHAFELPNDKNYHVIATTPIINTSAVIHHMIMSMCESWQGNDTVFNQSVECFMGGFNCYSIVGLWAVGATGQCLLDEFGFRIGKDGFKYALLEIHWNNGQGLDSYVDSSGLTLYYTPKLRNNDGSVLQSGQMSLDIPPGLSSVTFNLKCSDYCTSKLTRAVNIAWVTLHMHGLGKSGHIDLYRGGKLRAVLLNSTNFDYNDPPQVDFRVPYEFLPGDEIHATCVFDTTSRNTTVRFGEGTMDEMCYVFLTYYPADPSFTYCSQYRTAEQCSNVGPNCDYNTFSILSKTVQSVCTTFPNCSRSCQVVMQGIVDTGCLDGDIGLWLDEFVPGIDVLRMLTVECGVLQNTDATAATTPRTTVSDMGRAFGLMPSWITTAISTFIVLAMASLLLL